MLSWFSARQPRTNFDDRRPFLRERKPANDGGPRHLIPDGQRGGFLDTHSSKSQGQEPSTPPGPGAEQARSGEGCCPGGTGRSSSRLPTKAKHGDQGPPVSC